MLRDELDMSEWSESRRRVHNKYRNGAPTRRERRRDQAIRQTELDEAPLPVPRRSNPYVEQANRRQGGGSAPNVFINLNQGHGIPYGQDEDSHM